MSRVSVRDLRTRFPVVRAAVEREGEVVVTEHGKPTFVLRAYVAPLGAAPVKRDYYARLIARMPQALTAAEQQALDDANHRDER